METEVEAAPTFPLSSDTAETADQSEMIEEQTSPSPPEASPLVEDSAPEAPEAPVTMAPSPPTDAQTLVCIKEEVKFDELNDDKTALGLSAHNSSNGHHRRTLPDILTKRSACRERVVSLKTDLHDKGNLLANTWNDLYTLLGEYQAQLFSSEDDILNSKERYEDASNEQLRNELVEKDNIIRELEDRLANAESQIETVRLDLSVKNSLLNKYQQELLEKESSLLSTQAARQKLENKNRVLETKLATRLDNTNTRTLTNPAPNRTMGMVNRGVNMGVGNRVMNSGMGNRVTNAGLGNRMVGTGFANRGVSSGLLNTRILPTALKRKNPPYSVLPGNVKRRAPVPIQMHQSLKPATTSSANTSSSTVVCIDDDDDDVKEITTGLSAGEPVVSGNSGSVNDPLYMDVWTDQQDHHGAMNLETTASGRGRGVHAGHGYDDSQTSEAYSIASSDGGLVTFNDQNIDGTIPEDALQGWDMQATTSAGFQSQMPGMAGDGESPQKTATDLWQRNPSRAADFQTVWLCSHCGATFRRKNDRDRHVSSIHLNGAIHGRKQRKAISIGVKLDIISRVERGQRISDVGRLLGFSESTVRTIRDNAVKIKRSALSGTSVSATQTSHARSSIMENMERILSNWIEEQIQCNIPVSMFAAQTKARLIYDELAVDESDSRVFIASKGWFVNFRRRYKFHNIKMAGEGGLGDIGNADYIVEYD